MLQFIAEYTLFAHSRKNACLMSSENHIAALQVGKLTDHVVLGRDYKSMPTDVLFEISCLTTMAGRRFAYRWQQTEAIDAG